ncbi:MAG: hypothetical protein ACLQJ0_03480 [Steroidobacteraceae bacterium]|jgi:hypothetical protein
MIRMRIVGTLALAAAIAMSGVALAADTTNPFLGTWALNVAKSTFDPGPPLKSNTLTITDAGNGAVHEVIDYVEGDGSATHMELTTAFDGKEVPVTGGGEADAVIATQPDPRTVKFVFKKAGKWVETGRFTLSKSGKTLHGPPHGKDAQGAWKYHYVYERQ